MTIISLLTNRRLLSQTKLVFLHPMHLDLSVSRQLRSWKGVFRCRLGTPTDMGIGHEGPASPGVAFNSWFLFRLPSTLPQHCFQRWGRNLISLSLNYALAGFPLMLLRGWLSRVGSRFLSRTLTQLHRQVIRSLLRLRLLHLPPPAALDHPLLIIAPPGRKTRRRRMSRTGGFFIILFLMGRGCAGVRFQDARLRLFLIKTRTRFPVP